MANDSSSTLMPEPATTTTTTTTTTTAVVLLLRPMAEAKRLAKQAVPCVLSLMLSMANRMVVTIVVGRLGAQELAAASLAVMFINVLGLSILTGLCSGLETLAAQAIGSHNKRLAGVFLQRSLLINAAVCIPLVVIWIFAESLLLLAGQETDLAHMAGNYVRILLISLPATAVNASLMRFLLAQGLMNASFYVNLVVFPLNVGMQYLFVLADTPLKIGFYGAPWASNIAEYLSAIGLIGYAIFVRGHEAWQPWSRDALKAWPQYFKLGIPGVIMLCAEWWMFETVTLLAGLFGAHVLATQAIVLNTAGFLFMVYLGISIVNGVAVGNSLGAGNAAHAALSAKVSVLLAVSCALVISLVMYFCRHSWGYIFTTDASVVASVATILPIAALFQFVDGGVGVLLGVLRGAGKQKLGAVLNVVSYYLVGIPLASVLAFVAKMELTGLWTGIAVAQCLSFCFLAFVVFVRIDWDHEVARAKKRLGQNAGGALAAAEDDDEDVIKISDV
ncbi:mate-domain-containing protein [Blastocladiella britannica]|nr:mate-domain-containing protein [Blastocladiella britannica]